MPDRKTLDINVTGMTCASCSRIVEKNLSKVTGVIFASVNLATGTAFAVVEDGVDRKSLEEAVQKAGYGVSHEKAEDLDRMRYRDALKNLCLSWLVTGPLMLLMILHMGGMSVPHYHLFELIGASLVLFVPGWGVLRSAYIALSHFHANMDVLVSLGASAALGSTLLSLLGVPLASFGAISAMIVALHLTGRFIESWLRDRASKEIKDLIGIQAKEARVLRDGEIVALPIEAVKEGFLVSIRPGERFPTDGVVSKGVSSVDESMITGESMPVSKKEGEEVTGGSINLSGSLEVKVTRVGEDSFLSQMIDLIKEAQGSKVPIQAFADRITGIFVPIVASLALAAGLFWYFNIDGMSSFLDIMSRYIPWVTDVRDPFSMAIFVFVTTIVIACPCALGLATPMALITGTSAASKSGVLIRNAEAIQTLKEVSVVVLDKTGTITEGRPSVVYHNLDEEAAKTVALMESRSTHPLASAISSMAAHDEDYIEVEEVSGEGVYSVINGVKWFVGKALNGGDYEHEYEQGRTVVEVRMDGEKIGYISLMDSIRPDSVEAVERLKSMGIRPVMATGDNRYTALKVARHVGIDEDDVYYEVKPDRKLSIVRDRQSGNAKVLMVGDGMNDAAALKGADVGVAIGSGTDLAIESADMIMTKGSIGSLSEAVAVSQKTFSVIRENLIWAFGYNLLALPLAMAGLLHPVVAEVAMTFSSISVILNSMRIKGKSIHKSL